MKRYFQLLLLASVIVAGATSSQGAEMDINTILMRSTFKISGKETLGTAFIIGRPVPGESEKLFYVLVTAAHVLQDIKEDHAILYLRRKDGEEFVKFQYRLQIRKDDQPLWTKHPEADVAVMYVRLPKEADVKLLPMSLLVTEQQLEEYEIHPGDVLSCLGYPYGAEANQSGFPILRSGQIASYPLTPTSKIQTFLFDFRVFGGNSGGPVYFVSSNRTYGGGVRLGQTINVLAGLVSEEKVIKEEIRSLTETRLAKHPLSLAVVVHAALIRETIELLPPQPVE